MDLLEGTPNKLTKAIEDLDAFLWEGYEVFRKFSPEYNKLKGSPDFNPEKLIKKQDDELDTWHKKIVEYIKANLDKNRYLFHFIRPKGHGSGVYVGIPIGLSNLRIAFEEFLWALEEIIIDLEERSNLAVRREIAEKEYRTDVLYRVTYSDHTREVKLNNIVLTKTDFDSENDNCFSYIYANPNRPIGLEELGEALKDKIKKRLAHIVRDLGFTKELKDIFFPVVTKTNVTFINPITKQYAYKHNLPPINFKKIGRQSETE